MQLHVRRDVLKIFGQIFIPLYPKIPLEQQKVTFLLTHLVFINIQPRFKSKRLPVRNRVRYIKVNCKESMMKTSSSSDESTKTKPCSTCERKIDVNSLHFNVFTGGMK